MCHGGQGLGGGGGVFLRNGIKEGPPVPEQSKLMTFRSPILLAGPLRQPEKS